MLSGPGGSEGVQFVRGKLARSAQINDAITNNKLLNKDQKGGRNGNGVALSTIPSYVEIIRALHKDKKLPAIVFIFSRNGCDDAGRTVCAQKGLKLLNKDESRQVDDLIEEFLKNNVEIPIAKGVCMLHLN